MALVMGVDSSTQSCKVLIVDAATGAVVRSGRAPHPPGTEVDPEQWWVAMQAAIAAAGGMEDVAAWSIGGQQHGMVVLDEHGAVIRDALLWNDTRSGAAATELTAEFGADALARRTGLVPVASFTITKLRWLRGAEPGNAERVAAVALPHDWLTWRLRGYGAVAPDAAEGAALDELVTDRSDASGTGYWNPQTGDYDRELLTAALGHDAALPRVLGAREWTTDAAGRRVGPGAGDNAAAALGVGAVTGDVVVSIGTSGTVFAVSETRTVDPSGTAAGFADAAGGYLPLVATLNAARVLDAAARLLGVDHDGLTELALAATPGSGGVVLVPWFEGERTPNLPHARASIAGLSLENTTRENLARAAIEGMLAGLATGLDAIRALGVTAERVLLVGGAARNPAVARVAAQVFDVPVAVPAAGEYVALGAARQAAAVWGDAWPRWTVEMDREAVSDPVPGIRAAYDLAAGPRAEEWR
ncbi:MULTISPECIES: FGGY family carbohydrate kinase [unclassified Microbacterium]|uniref:FGGY family carbohydrate kinase n=1 Tax=unclassified Microbacterium TaxID=2609290 RepID=UPI00386F3AEA